MKKINLLLIAFVLLIGCGHKSELQSNINFEKNKNVRKYALIVGVGEYKNNVETLFGVEKDLQKIKRLLNHLHVNKIVTLQDSYATLHRVRKEFYSYIHSKKNVKKNTFIFYYSGHGVQVVDENGDETDRKDEATALYDFEIDKNKFITKGVLLDDELHTLLAQIKSKKILIFDKCHSGSSHRDYNPFVKSINGEYKLSANFLENITINKRAKNLKNFIIFSATKDNQKAEDSPEGGLFTNSFIEGINSNKRMNLLELREFCKGHIHFLAKKMNQKYKVKLKGDADPLFISSNGLNLNLASIFN